MQNNPLKAQQPEHRTIVTEQYQGPIPTPKMMDDFSKIDQSFPGRLMTLAEKADERRTLEVRNQSQLIENQKRIIDGNNSTAKLGLVLTFILSFFCLVCAAIFVFKGYNVAAFVAVIIPAATFINTYFKKGKK